MINVKETENLVQYIKSNEYFKDARLWYRHKYMTPMTQRSMAIVVLIVTCFILVGLILITFTLFPLSQQVKYAIKSSDVNLKNARIIPADAVTNDARLSIAYILLNNYVKKQEEFSYDNLKNQFLYIKNNSTRLVFRRFYNLMSIDNPTSPVMRFKQNIKRTIKILSSNLASDSKFIVKFETFASNNSQTLENMVFEATIAFEIDKINLNSSPDSRFNFIVTDYKLKLIKDKLK